MPQNLVIARYYAKTKPKDWSKVHAIKYIIGPIRHARCYGMVNLKAGRYPGLIERFKMPVICEYAYEPFDGFKNKYAKE